MPIPSEEPNRPEAGVLFTLPTEFDGYRILGVLGQGGMGTVFLGHDTLLDRPIAIKFIRSPRASARELFLNEARTAAKLQHPNVVSIYRVGEISGQPYIISEYLRGRSLDKLPRPVAWQRVLLIGIELARGLSAAHQRGILHRDLKPSNAIEAADGSVKLCDFGLAKFHRPLEPTQAAADPNVLPLAAAAAPGNILSPTLEWSPVALPEKAPPEHVGDGLSASEESGSLPQRAIPDQQESAGGSLAANRTNPPSVLKGTPEYMAPEVLLGNPASRLSDVYSLGALLYSLGSERPPFGDLPLAALISMITTVDAPPLGQVAPGMDPLLAEVIDRCLKRDPSQRFASADELLEALQALHTGREALPIPPGNPYRGLLPFEAEHRAVFFGRRSEIGTIVERLRTEPLLIVVADSGIGKSSLIRAGVLPVLSDGGLGQQRTWKTVTLVPGRQPLATLRESLATLVSGALPECLPASLGRELARLLGNTLGAVVFIDQVEELITLSDKDEAQQTGEAIASLSSCPGSVRVILTARADYLSRLGALPGLGAEITRAFYLLRPLGRAQLRDVIVGPASQKSVHFESPELVDELVDSTAHTVGALPLLQFALAELWEVKAGNVITRDALNSIGGVDGALSRHGDHVFSRLVSEQRDSARRILLDLVTLEKTRTRRTDKELVRHQALDRTALDALVAGRLVVAREAPEGTVYEVAHEALIRGWDSLRRWLAESMAARALKQRLEAATSDWQRLGNATDLLWSKAQLAETAILSGSDLGPEETGFLVASRRAVRQRRIRQQALMASVPALVLCLYGALRLLSSRELDRRVYVSLSQNRELITQAQTKQHELGVLRDQAFGLFDGQQREAAEQKWSQVLGLGVSVDRLYARAGQNLEAVLSLDRNRQDVKSLLADALYARALGAERDHENVLRDDLLERMKLYDSDGSRQQSWSAPGKLRIDSNPPGARVTIGQYQQDADKQLRLAMPRQLGTTPLAAQTVAQGSYLVTLSAAGRPEVRYPVLVGRGESLSIQIALPDTVPGGFVYVPAGRTRFGTAGEEALRQKFFNTVPAHQVMTEGYYIARYETTFGEYIDFLSALPKAELDRHRPQSGAALPTGGGAVDLSELGDGRWLLHIQPQAVAFRIATGEPLTYPTRPRRTTQDWYRLPVTGISRRDADAYTAWLDRTGRVPGARLCTELQWERAARGADDRDYPQGNTVSADDANIDITYGKKLDAIGPDQVGQHPASRSPFGVDDMLGNAYELTVSSLAADETVGRGGSYGFDALTGRSVNRNPLEAGYRGSEVGLRVCASLPPTQTTDHFN